MSKGTRLIAVVTGTRAEYGIFRTVIRAIENHPNLDYTIIVTGMHLLDRFGNTIRFIEEDGYKIGAKVQGILEDDSDTPASMARALGREILGMADAFERLKPDIVLVLGDRDEPLAAAAAAAHMNIPIAHMHGGEISGTIDESIRHAITKFSHIHLAATKLSCKRIRQLGEREDMTFLVGSAGLDEIYALPALSREDIAAKFGFDPSKKMLLVVQHPVTTEFDEREKNISSILAALERLNIQTLLIYSNADAGNESMMTLVKQTLDRQPNIKMFKSIDRQDYLHFMKHCDAMMGNSSSGIIEAPTCGTPYVCVGTRQNKRERAVSVIDVPYDADKIVDAVTRAMDPPFKEQIKHAQRPYDPFSDGKTGERIANVLAQVAIDKSIIQKEFIDV